MKFDRPNRPNEKIPGPVDLKIVEIIHIHINTNLVAMNIENVENTEFCKQVAGGLRRVIISYEAKSSLLKD